MAIRQHYFATDMMRYMANKCGIDWVPPEGRNELSPFTEYTIAGVEVYLQKWDNNILLLYEATAYGRWEGDFLSIVKHFIIGPRIHLRRHVFEVCTAVARLASLYYSDGRIDIPNLAVKIIERILHQFAALFDGDIFLYFDVQCVVLHICR